MNIFCNFTKKKKFFYQLNCSVDLHSYSIFEYSLNSSLWYFLFIEIVFYRVYCLIGDGESAEGSIWEALHFASYYKLDNLCVIFDVNRLGQSEPTSLQHNMEVYRKRLDAFGCNAVVVDGHDVEELCKVKQYQFCACFQIINLIDKWVSFSYFLDKIEAELRGVSVNIWVQEGCKWEMEKASQ